MIAPHGGTLVNRVLGGQERERLLASVARLPTLELDAWALSDVEMIALGGFSPLDGFMRQTDYDQVVVQRRLKNGSVWTIPVTLAVSAQQAKGLKGDVALTASGAVAAVLHLDDIYRPDKTREAQHVLGTTDETHPGVKRLQAAYGAMLLQILSVQTKDANVAAGVNLAINSLFTEYSQQDEFQADELAVKYMKKAGYDPSQMVAFLEILKQKQAKDPVRPYSYWRTHPHLSQRIAVTNKEIKGKLEFKDYLNIIQADDPLP